MQRQAFDESIQGVGAALREIGAESIAPHILHFMLVGQGRDSALWIFARKGFEEEDEVCEAAADGEGGSLEGLEVGLWSCDIFVSIQSGMLYIDWRVFIFAFVETKYET